MTKKVSIVLAIAMILALATPVMASPFTDVPADHWAYDAIKEVSEAGIVTGYEDGTFKGDEKLTRYEMAVIAARISSQVEEGEATDKVMEAAEALTAEFSDELAALDNRVTALEDKGLNVKIGGEATTVFTDTNVEGTITGNEDQYWEDWDDTLDDDAPAQEELKQEFDFDIQTIVDENTNVTLTLDTITDGFGDFTSWDGQTKDEDSKELSLDNALLAVTNPNYGLRIGDFEDYHVTDYFYNEEDVEGIEATANLFDTDLMVFKGQDDDTADQSDAQDILGLEAARNIAGIDVTGQYLEADEEGIYGVTAATELMPEVDSNVKYFAFDNDQENNYLVDGEVATKLAGINTTVGYKKVGENFEVVNTLKADDDIYDAGEDYEPGIKGVRVAGDMDVAPGLNVFASVEDEELANEDIFTTEVGAKYAVDETTTLSGSYELADADNDTTTLNAGLEGSYFDNKLATVVDYELEDIDNGEETSTLDIRNEYALTDATAVTGDVQYETVQGTKDTERTYYAVGADHKLTDSTTVGVNYRVLDFENNGTSAEEDYKAESINGELNIKF
ncbi:S-layer homology domain-containing protein [Acetohalobium arabaticum]|uniref:S-layer domain protein n=1 Tax=Acetohalobium arabaticum (strain ATCC 49924 / DSM 5501 / Z-7288) TaxID=574087 RepID=D9QTT9_ACEAZ|nr:S-layer homology domain-containing protein [Acetohalobium arabaticum]ADL13660.1 S-layer domain protein [Acetohalobium arabaticum DSM 5501]